MNLRQAAEKALIQLQGDDAYLGHRSKKRADAIEALRQALAQPVDNVYICEKCVHKTEKSIHEPVAWMKSSGLISPYKHGSYQIPLYTAPPKREWVGLTDEEIGTLTVFDGLHHIETPLLADFIRAIEAKLKEKNV